MFKKSFEVSVCLFLFTMLSIVFKDMFLGGEKTTSMNSFLLISTIIFVISMIVTTIFYFINKGKENTNNYKNLFIVVWIFVPVICLLTEYYLASPLPHVLSEP